MTKTNYEFRTEVKRMLDLIIHSLYSHQDIFLRELVSNASDAIDKLRYLSLTDKTVVEDGGEFEIRIIPDKAAGTLTVRDNGIGMSKDEIVEALGTIAYSGTREFLAALQNAQTKDNPELIGQFGVGFYSAFIVAERVCVYSRKAGSDPASGVRWESTGDGHFTVEDSPKESRGTDVILYLKEEEKEFLNEWRIREVIKKYSDYIEHPVKMAIEREQESELEKGERVKITEDEVLNSQKAIWVRNKSEVTPEEYNSFYQHISRDFTDPAKVIHYHAEGSSEFIALLYIPSKAPFNIYHKDYEIGPMLYVKRVQIMDHCEELLPTYLRFVKGVVDSADLPLNVSREILQSNRQVEIMRKNLTKKVLDTLDDMKTNEYEAYLKFYSAFGKVLKEGLYHDFSRREQLSDLLLFQSVKKETGEYLTLQQYVEQMPESQDAIYYFVTSSWAEAVRSPYLEAFKAKGYDVLILTDEIDDFTMGALGEYKGKTLKSVVKGDLTLDDGGQEERKQAEQQYKGLLDLFSDRLKDQVKEVRFSGRLTDTACCLVADEQGLDPHMEKLFKAMGQEVPVSKRIFEVNPSHPLVAAMQTLFDRDPQHQLLADYVDLLYNQALLLEGSQVKDTVAFTAAMTRLMVHHAQQEGKQG